MDFQSTMHPRLPFYSENSLRPWMLSAPCRAQERDHVVSCPVYDPLSSTPPLHHPQSQQTRLATQQTSKTRYTCQRMSTGHKRLMGVSDLRSKRSAEGVSRKGSAEGETPKLHKEGGGGGDTSRACVLVGLLNCYPHPLSEIRSLDLGHERISQPT